MKISRETARIYIELFKHEAYINDMVQPHFWQAVEARCEDQNADISNLIVDDEKKSIIRCNRYTPVPDLKLEGVSTIFDYVDYWVKIIIEEESKGVPSRAEFYKLQREFMSLRQLL